MMPARRDTPLVLIFVYAAVSMTTADTVTVTTDIGDVTGVSGVASFDGVTKPFTQFLGVPYALAPTGEYRFAKPRPLSELPQSPYNATYRRPPCPQNPAFAEGLTAADVSEDCLHLNIYVPGSSVTDSTEKYAVMIWIYGGAFVFGKADDYIGDVLSAFNDVIVVTLNYRLSVFGFLSSGDDTCLGNFGLWDQQLAIRWVHDNIARFGGDGSRITVFGESAGGASVLYQTLYRGNDGVFQRGIAQSGASLAPWAIQREPVTNFYNFSRTVGCPYINKEQAVECLRSKSVAELMPELTSADSFFPSMDGEIVTEMPSVTFENVTSGTLEHFAEKDLLIGMNSKDGMVDLLLVPALKSFFFDITGGIPRSEMEDGIIPFFVEQLNQTENSVLKTAIIHQYSDWTDPESKIAIRDKMIDLSSDVNYHVPALRTIVGHEAAAGVGRSYLYEFSQKSPIESWYSPAWLDGANHGEEIAFVFGFTQLNHTIISDDLMKLSKTIMELWTSFAKFGNPNNNSMLSYQWPEYEAGSGHYLDISDAMMSRSTVKTRLAAERMAFWQNLVPRLRTCEPECQACDNRGTKTSSAVALHTHYMSAILVASICISIF